MASPLSDKTGAERFDYHAWRAESTTASFERLLGDGPRELEWRDKIKDSSTVNLGDLYLDPGARLPSVLIRIYCAKRRRCKE